MSITNYTNAHDALSNYLSAIPGGWNVVTVDSVIDGPTFRTNWSSYYTEKQLLLNAIVAAAKVLAGTAQTQANTATTNAATAQNQANTAISNPYTANSNASVAYNAAGVADGKAVAANSAASAAATAANNANTAAGNAQITGNNIISGASMAGKIDLNATLHTNKAGYTNTNVTIGASGALSGAGGGSVTLPGLGGELGANVTKNHIPTSLIQGQINIGPASGTIVAAGGTWSLIPGWGWSFSGVSPSDVFNVSAVLSIMAPGLPNTVQIAMILDGVMTTFYNPIMYYPIVINQWWTVPYIEFFTNLSAGSHTIQFAVSYGSWMQQSSHIDISSALICQRIY